MLPSTSAIDVLDRVLDKGIVIDAWLRLSLGGIDLVTVDAHIVVASIETYLGFAAMFAATRPTAFSHNEAQRGRTALSV